MLAKAGGRGPGRGAFSRRGLQRSSRSASGTPSSRACSRVEMCRRDKGCQSACHVHGTSTCRGVLPLRLGQPNLWAWPALSQGP